MISSDSMQYEEAFRTAQFKYVRNKVGVKSFQVGEQTINLPHVTQEQTDLLLRTQNKVSKTGIMIVGWGGSNGTTLTAGILANKMNLKWADKNGIHAANYFGSMTQTSTVLIGTDENASEVYSPFKNLLPMLNLADISITGWDINNTTLGEAAFNARVLDIDIQRQLKDVLNKTPLPSVWYPNFYSQSVNQKVNNILVGTKKENLEKIRQDIQKFRTDNQLETVIVIWSASTERMISVEKGVNTTEEEIMTSIEKDHTSVSPSQIFAVASILEGCPFVNCAAQNTLLPGIAAMAISRKVFIVGDDLKSGQTKLKSVLMEYLIGSGIKPKSIVSYNHLGNEDGKNLTEPETYMSKMISKSNLVDIMTQQNKMLFPGMEKTEQQVVIRYVPSVGDSKRAFDEYSSEIFMGGTNTMAIYNVCEDSLLAAPLIMDTIVLLELFSRITYKVLSTGIECDFERFDPVLSCLGYWFKSPLYAKGSPSVSLARQRMCLVNIVLACAGIQPNNEMLLEAKIEL